MCRRKARTKRTAGIKPPIAISRSTEGAICRKSAENVEENKENEGAEVERLILSKSDGSSVCLAHLLIWMHHKM
jgi:hypothetical protein